MPLTEDCGIVEWVPHTTGLRHCCQAAYIAEGLYAGQKTNSAIKKVYDNYPVRHSGQPLLNSFLQVHGPCNIFERPPA